MIPFSTNALKNTIGGRDEAPTPCKITLTTLSSFFDSKLVGTEIGCIVSRGLGKRESQQGRAGRGLAGEGVLRQVCDYFSPCRLHFRILCEITHLSSLLKLDYLYDR